MNSKSLISLLGIGMVAKNVLQKATSASYLSDKVVLIKTFEAKHNGSE